jgi:hypothetical protein
MGPFTFLIREAYEIREAYDLFNKIYAIDFIVQMTIIM